MHKASSESRRSRARRTPTFVEFFAGGGMVRAGLGEQWRCAFANDFDPKKCAAYRENWGAAELHEGDIGQLSTDQLPASAIDLAWASFPCQDLSVAGLGAGLQGQRSSAFWLFWSLLQSLQNEGRVPPIVTLENVCGTLTSHEGRDFREIVKALVKLNYRVGAIVIDAKDFVPQSRPRLFVVAVQSHISLGQYALDGAHGAHHSQALVRAYDMLSPGLKKHWIWWDLPAAPPRTINLIDIIEDEPSDVKWQSAAETQNILDLMAPIHLAKVAEARASGRRMVGTVYRRMRRDAHGGRYQRAEIRFDGLAGCLRTPGGGSSRQLLLFVEGDVVRSRLLSSRETARLMGLPESYVLPKRYTDAYHLTGDGVASPVVKHLSERLFLPLLNTGV
ncbi:DNA cytosine methyltransferase [Vitreimonas sp.]|uniref:DNA cytosine methyltransferase n=1 Tax=Vitreimonas sp. TaxID=3069702 RepID=UPI002EDB639D